ncbi:MAG TPA: M48 family metallopeptidase [Candidatus Acidoferrales bacterium]|nr:M48 family metallopeptidase [Candidatus Acidoferrales bacterium]
MVKTIWGQMTRTRILLVILPFLLTLGASLAAARPWRRALPNSREQAPVAKAAPASGVVQAQVQPPQMRQKVMAYTLPPGLYKKAKALSRIHFWYNLISFLYGLIVFWLILRWKLAPRYRDWAERSSPTRFLQAFVFSPLLIVTIAVLESPAAICEHLIDRAYGLSVEEWGSLAWDWAKGLFLLIVIGSVLVWLLYGIVHRSPRRWWLYFWLISLPILVFLSFIEPFVLEPMFFKFAPLDQKDPALVAQIERVVQRAGLNIPPNRMFWMKASDKTPTMNAYVSGLGASKRIVIWDTTLEKETTPEIVAVIGHEMGHYVLGHVWKGLIFTVVVLLVLLYLGYRSIGWMLARWGAAWRIRGPGDWASLPALLLLLSIFSFISDPVSNAFSRHIEHQADVYGLEVTHGMIPDAGQAAADSFQVEGASALADPDPRPVNVFLFYDHPPISDRVRLCLTYDPWSQGKAPQFVK